MTVDIASLVSDNLDIWTTAVERKSGAGRGGGKRVSLYGIDRLRALILDLAVRGKLVPQQEDDAPAAELLQILRPEQINLLKNGRTRIDKAHQPIPHDRKIFELPKGWEWVRLVQLTEQITSGSRDWSKYLSSDGAKFVTMGNLSRGSYQLRLDKMHFVQIGSDREGARTSLRPGDLLVSITGDVGNMALIPEEFGEAYINQHTAMIRFLPTMRGRFVPEALRSPIAQKQFNGPQRGVKNSFRLSDVQNIEIPLPPLAEQQRIVAKVDELMALCDALEDESAAAMAAHQMLVETLLTTLIDSTDAADLATNWARLEAHFDTLFTTEASVDALKQIILKLAVRGKLVEQNAGDQPASELLKAIKQQMADFARKGRARTPTASAEIRDADAPFALPQGWQFARFSDVLINRDSERVPISSEERMGRKGEYDYYGASGVIDHIDGYIFDEPLLLIGEDGANLINRSTPIAFIAEGKYWVNNHAHVLQALSMPLLRYMALYINAIDLKPYVTGTAQPKMNQAKMNSIVVAVPPANELERIVAKIDELDALCDTLKSRIIEAGSTQKHLADAIVERAAA